MKINFIVEYTTIFSDEKVQKCFEFEILAEWYLDDLKKNKLIKFCRITK